MSHFARAVLVLAVCSLAAPALAAANGMKKGPPITIYAGPNLDKKAAGVSDQADALTFVPSNVTIRQGQSVTWQFRGFHTVTFAGTNTNPPFVTPHPELPQPAVNDAAGSPFWWVGKAPTLMIDPYALAPQGGATISKPTDVRSSGLLRVITAPPNTPPTPYRLSFLKPGTYHYLCLVHPGMKGTIRVLAGKKAKPATPARVAKQATAQLAGVVGKLKELEETKPSDPLQILVGAGAENGAEIASFFPNQVSVGVGQTLAFVQNDPTDIHTVTFGPDAYTALIEQNFVHMQGSPPAPVLNPLGALPSDPPGSPSPVPYDGSNHGNGYIGSGILYPPQAPTEPHQYAVKFTKPGTYHLECVIHRNMDATVVVH